MKTNAWMLRQDGKYWGVKVHLYVEDDSDLSSAAEAASFIIYSDSKDQQYAKLVLDAWMALLIEYSVSYDADSQDIDDAIMNATSHLGYKFPFDVSDRYLEIHHELGNYYNVDTLYEFVDSVKDDYRSICDNIRRSLNQQFCRVRYGGQYSSDPSNSALWFRVSSVGYNWVNTIYVFVSNHYRSLNATSIFICRDFESDNGDNYDAPEYFYKAKDGVPYYNMPIDEYLEEEHEHSPVFSDTDIGHGVICATKRMLQNGSTYLECMNNFYADGIDTDLDVWNHIKRQETNTCIESSYLEDANIREQNKLHRVINRIMSVYPEITSVDIPEVKPRANRNGKMVASEVIFHITNTYPVLDNADVGVICMRGLSDATEDTLFRGFKNEYEPYRAAMLSK